MFPFCLNEPDLGQRRQRCRILGPLKCHGLVQLRPREVWEFPSSPTARGPVSSRERLERRLSNVTRSFLERISLSLFEGLLVLRSDLCRRLRGRDPPVLSGSQASASNTGIPLVYSDQLGP